MRKTKAVLKAMTPPFLWDLGRASLSRLRSHESEKIVKVGKFEILVPSESLLSRLANGQPYRNLAIGIIAKFVGARDKNAVIIDVGANVGGTSAMIASYCQNPLVLVEPSEHYLAYLTRNAALFPNRCRFLKAIITDGSVASPTMEHRGGSAKVVEKASGQGDPILQLRLGDVESEGVALVKIDADGWDFKIVQDSIAWLESQQPIIYYEAEIDTIEQLQEANQVIAQCWKAGYRRAIIWDDAGCCLCATEHTETVGDLQRYLFECRRQPARQGLHSYNVGLFQEKDRDLYNRVAGYFRGDRLLQTGRAVLDD